VKQFVDDAVHVARQTINQPFIVVGHSLGAMVACGVAERLKDMVIGAILEDPPFGTMGSRIGTLPFLNQFQGIQDIMRQERWHDLKDLAKTLGDLTIRDPNSERTFRLGDVRDAATLRFNAACLIKMDPEVLTPVIEGDWLRGFPWERIVTGIDCPTLLLQADVTTGGMLVDDDVTTMKDLVRDLTVIRFPKTAHQIHTTALEAYLRVVIPFLESLTIENPI
jgi:pimeloyl-ACP methyl ester carboxylesterase